MNLNRSSYPVWIIVYLCCHDPECSLPAVGEDEEISIKEVTDAIVEAVGFDGEYSVSPVHSSVDLY